MNYQKKPFGDFHLEFLGVSKRQLPKMLQFGLDLNVTNKPDKFMS